MGIVESFMAYAADFEKTLVDDDWSRLERYFHDDALYRVESELFGCELRGRDAIFAGIKKSLDGFDRQFEGRDIALDEGPIVSDDELSVAWTVTYRKEGLSPFVLRGRSRARIEGDLITLLVDSYDERVGPEAEAWMQETGIRLDPSYV